MLMADNQKIQLEVEGTKNTVENKEKHTKEAESSSDDNFSRDFSAKFNELEIKLQTTIENRIKEVESLTKDLSLKQKNYVIDQEKAIKNS